MNKTSIIITAIACVLVAAAFTLSLTLKGTVDRLQDSYSQLRSQNASLQSQLTTEQQQESRDVANLNSKLGTLSTPTDPLSAYDQICSGDQTDQQTDSSSLYFYWPCTDSAETIPQPGA